MNTIGRFIKVLLFAVVILVLGSVIHWRGGTVSDQVKKQVTQVEKSDTAAKIKKWSSDITEEARANAKKAFGKETKRRSEAAPPSPEHLQDVNATRFHEKVASSKPEPIKKDIAALQQEKIAPTERQKLRALIQELNTAETAKSD